MTENITLTKESRGSSAGTSVGPFYSAPPAHTIGMLVQAKGIDDLVRPFTEGVGVGDWKFKGTVPSGEELQTPQEEKEKFEREREQQEAEQRGDQYPNPLLDLLRPPPIPHGSPLDDPVSRSIERGRREQWERQQMQKKMRQIEEEKMRQIEEELKKRKNEKQPGDYPESSKTEANA